MEHIEEQRVTRIEYELLRQQEPHLKLPMYPVGRAFSPESAFAKKVAAVNREELISRRAALLLKGDSPLWIVYDP